MENAIVSEMMRERERYARAGCSKDRGCPGQADRPVFEHPVNEVVLPLPEPGALLREQRIAGPPGQHQERDDAGHQQREPIALDQLGRVGGDKDQLDDQEKSVDRRDQQRVVALLQGDQRRQHGGDRHQRRDGVTQAAEGAKAG